MNFPQRAAFLVGGLVLGSLCVLNAAQVSAEEDKDEFQSMINGKDLSNWAPVSVKPETFTLREDGVIFCTGKPTGVMRTKEMYENFIMEVEWRHLKPKGNAGIFIWSDAKPETHPVFTRSIEVQVLDGRETKNYTSHGDVFAIHGAKLTPDRPHPSGAMRCLPSEKRAKPSPEWNHYRIHCNDGRITLAVNGKVVSGGSDCHPRKGYICLESEGSPCEFRNLRIKLLPSTGATAEETAKAAEEEKE